MKRLIVLCSSLGLHEKVIFDLKQLFQKTIQFHLESTDINPDILEILEICPKVDDQLTLLPVTAQGTTTLIKSLVLCTPICL